MRCLFDRNTTRRKYECNYKCPCAVRLKTGSAGSGEEPKDCGLRASQVHATINFDEVAVISRRPRTRGHKFFFKINKNEVFFSLLNPALSKLFFFFFFSSMDGGPNNEGYVCMMWVAEGMSRMAWGASCLFNPRMRLATPLDASCIPGLCLMFQGSFLSLRLVS